MRRTIVRYRELIGVVYKESPALVLFVFASAIVSGLFAPLTIWVNSQIFDLGISVAAGKIEFSWYIPYIALFVAVSILPSVLGDMFLYSFAVPRSQLILRTAYKGKMLQKLSKMRYEHLEMKSSMEIIDKAYGSAESSAIALFPTHAWRMISTAIATGATIYYLCMVRWWFLPVILLPFALETWLVQKSNYNIHREMQKYWKEERSFTLLGKMLRSREYTKENRLFGVSDFLIQTYRKRLNGRNHEYEKFYFKHLRHHFAEQNITKLAQIACALILLVLYGNGALSIGLLISLTIMIFTRLFSGGLNTITRMIDNIGYYMKIYEYYERYFQLSEDVYGDDDTLPAAFSIEFDNVFFTYPGSDQQVLKGLSLSINSGEKVSIVGMNGEGKTTMIKLLLGLFQVDSGEIRVGGKPLSSFTQSVRNRMFAPVFQDYVKYSLTLAENIGVGDVENMGDPSALHAAMKKAKVDGYASALSNGADTLLGRDFESGVDLSGGQWQRIAIARAYIGDKPILILDEPTSQLDPMIESQLYSEFAEMAKGKTAVFITHRLGSTKITDRIFVIANGSVAQAGTHDDLMNCGGLYADMFSAQKQWYRTKESEADAYGQ